MIIDDIARAMEAVSNEKTDYEKILEEFNSGKRLKWLEKYSEKTNYSYENWYSICKTLISFHIIPDLNILNQINMAFIYGMSPKKNLTKLFQIKEK